MFFLSACFLLNFSCVFLLKVFGSIFVVLKLDDRKAKTCFFAFLHTLERFLFFNDVFPQVFWVDFFFEILDL